VSCDASIAARSIRWLRLVITEAIEVPRRSARASSEVQTRREGGRGLFVIHRGHCHALRVQPADLLRGVATRHVRASLLSVPASETTDAAYMPRPLAGCLPRRPAPQIEPGQDRLGQERDEGCGARSRPIGRSWSAGLPTRLGGNGSTGRSGRRRSGSRRPPGGRTSARATCPPDRPASAARRYWEV
jgi:hypothetical protein